MMETRIAQILVDGIWTDIHYMQLKNGHIFRLFEEDGTPVIDNGNFVYVATSDVRMDMFTCRRVIDCYPVETQPVEFPNYVIEVYNLK